MSALIVKLGDICNIQSGGTPSRGKSEFWEGGCIPWVKISDMHGKFLSQTEEYITDAGLAASSAKMFSRGTILYTIFATLGETCILNIDATTNQAIAGISVKHEFAAEIAVEYLYYFLMSIKEHIMRVGRGVAQNNINLRILRNVNIVLPSLERQYEIVRRLSDVESILSLRQRQAEKLDELVKARFVEMFGDPCEMLHWECKKIEEVADVTVGVVVKPANFYTDDRLHGVKAFRSLNIGEMKVKDNDWVYFSEEGNAQNAKSQLHEGDVLVVRSGAPGTSCVVTKAYEGCNAIDVIIVHVDGIKLNPYYLCAFNNFPHGMRQMLKGVGGAAQKHLNVGKYNQMIVAIPPMKLQNEFVLFMDSVDCEKDRIQRSAALLETLKRSLMQQYFG